MIASILTFIFGVVERIPINSLAKVPEFQNLAMNFFINIEPNPC